MVYATISELMDYFMGKKAQIPKFSALSTKVKRLKETEGGG